MKANPVPEKEEYPDTHAVPDPDDIRERYPIEEDRDTLEPFDDESEKRIIDADDPEELHYWAAQFQISEQELKSAIALNVHSVREIKKYLSV